MALFFHFHCAFCFSRGTRWITRWKSLCFKSFLMCHISFLIIVKYWWVLLLHTSKNLNSWTNFEGSIPVRKSHQTFNIYVYKCNKNCDIFCNFTAYLDLNSQLSPVCSISSRAAAVLHAAMASFSRPLSVGWNGFFFPLLYFIWWLVSQSPTSISKTQLKVLLWSSEEAVFLALYNSVDIQKSQDFSSLWSAPLWCCRSDTSLPLLPGCRPEPGQRGLLQSEDPTSAFPLTPLLHSCGAFPLMGRRKDGIQASRVRPVVTDSLLCLKQRRHNGSVYRPWLLTSALSLTTSLSWTQHGGW